MLEQEFNGLYQRTVVRADTSQVRDGLDQKRRCFYDADRSAACEECRHS